MKRYDFLRVLFIALLYSRGAFTTAICVTYTVKYRNLN